MLKTWRIYFVSVCLSFSSVVQAEEAKQPDVKIPEITNWAQIDKNLKLSAYKGKKMRMKIKIAILDNGFNGYQTLLGNLLPKVDKETGFDNGKGSAADENPSQSLHGTFMALIASQVIARSGVEADYEMKLFNAYGYTKFEDAVNKVIEQKFDVVLYSQVWEYGGNGDGKGFINALVSKATAAGIIWINAAGNFGHLTRTAQIDGKAESDGEYVVFKDRKGKITKGAKVFCKVAKGQTCRARIVLAWNDFKDDSVTGTEKDLDLIVTDSKGKVVSKSERRQKLNTEGDKGASLFPREIADQNAAGTAPLDLEPGEYLVRAKVISKKFSASQDKLRITVGGFGVELADADREETLLPPADNPSVVIVGASDDFQTSRSASRKIPDILLPSIIKLKDGSAPFSTSIAAAMAAGLTVINLGVDTEKTKDAVSQKLRDTMSKSDKAAAKVVTSEPAKEDSKVAAAPAAKPKISIPMGKENNYRSGPTVAPPASNAPAGAPRPAAPAQVQAPGAPSAAPVAAAPAACLPRVQVPVHYQMVDDLLYSGAVVSVTYRGWVYLLADPRLVPQLRQLNSGERLFVSPEGFIPLPHGQVMAGGVPAHFYEVLPGPLYSICR